MGRPTKLTPKVQAAICEAIRSGATRECAASVAGIARSTLQLWLAQGADGGAPYSDFLDAVCMAEEDLQARAAKVVVDLLAEDNAAVRLNAAKFLLSHRFPEAWSTRKEVRQTGPDGGPVQVAAKVEAGLAPETMDALSPEAVADALVKLARGGGG